MGLFDKSTPSEDGKHEREIWHRLGKVEAEIDRLELTWQSYRDEIRRLVQRLEQRDRRAAKREAGEDGATESDEPARPVLDETTQRVLRRRQKSGLSG